VAKKLSFGVEPTMREVPPGQHAVIKFGKFTDWKIIETEKYGPKYSFPITLLEHPSYESIPRAGIQIDWQSKCGAAEQVFFYIYERNEDGTAGEMKTFDWDVEKEFNGAFKLHRFETGTYKLEQK